MEQHIDLLKVLQKNIDLFDLDNYVEAYKNRLPTPIDSVPDSPKEQTQDDILKSFRSYLDRHQMREAMELFQTKILVEINFGELAFDIVPIIMERLRGLLEYRFRTFNYCRDMLISLASECTPRDMLVIFLNELETDEIFNKVDEVTDEPVLLDSNCFVALLRPLSITLSALPGRKVLHFQTAVWFLQDHITRLSVKFLDSYVNPNCDNHESIVRHPEMREICYVLSAYTKFLNGFCVETEEAIREQFWVDESGEEYYGQLRNILLRLILRLLDYPLSNLVLHLTPRPPTEQYPMFFYFDQWFEVNFPNKKLFYEFPIMCARQLAYFLIEKIQFLQPNFVTLIRNRTLVEESSYLFYNMFEGEEEEDKEAREKNCVEKKVEDQRNRILLSENSFDMALAVIASLVHTRVFKNFLPTPYRPDYVFGLELPLVKTLLDSTAILVHEKGLKLLEAHLKIVHSLESPFLDLLRAHPVDKSLINVMVCSPNKDLRRDATALYRRLVLAFDAPSRYRFLFSSFTLPEQITGVRCLIIGIYKDVLNSDSAYQGSSLNRFARAVISHCSNALMQSIDLCFSAVNFFRFLYASDPKSKNSTGIWDLHDHFQKEFVDIMKNDIDKNETHCKKELMRLTEEKLKSKLSDKKQQKKQKRKKMAPEIKIANALPGDENLDFSEGTSIEEEHQTLLKLQQNFDLLRSIIARLDELVAQQKVL